MGLALFCDGDNCQHGFFPLKSRPTSNHNRRPLYRLRGRLSRPGGLAMKPRDLLPLLSGPKHSKARMVVRGMQALPIFGSFWDTDIACRIDRQAETITLQAGDDTLTLTFAQLETGHVEPDAAQ
jgi:hypothetical protein